MTLETYESLEQGTDEWFTARAGLVTASTVGQLISIGSESADNVVCAKCGANPWAPCVSLARKEPVPIKMFHDERVAAASELPPVYRVATGDAAQGLIRTLVAERLTGFVEMIQPSRDMERGTLDEPYARDVYSEHFAPATEVGFMVRDYGELKLGYSPDGLVGDDGLIEIKSRKQKIQLKTFLDDTVPAENMAQIQCGLLVSGRKWLDYVSYCGGMPLYVKRVYPDRAWQNAILGAAQHVEQEAEQMISDYLTAVDGMPQTERIDHFPEMEIL